jgi:outer membrane lipoprotein-sorting protein
MINNIGMFMKKLVILLIFLIIAIPVHSEAPTPNEILDKAENAIKGETSKGTFTMKVVTPEFSREVQMESWWKGNEKALIIIKAPAKDKGNKTLKIGNEMWNYLKNTETTMKIPSSMMLQSWYGSDLTNQDIVRESELSEDYNIRLMFEEKIGGEMCWKLELKPKPDLPVVWGIIYYWVRQSDYLPALVQYYSEKGELIRTFKFRDFKMMAGRKIPSIWRIESNTKDGHYTEFIHDDVIFDVKIPDRIFSFRELEK